MLWNQSSGFYHNGKDVYPELRRVMNERFPSPGSRVGLGEPIKGSKSELAVDHGDIYHQEKVRTEIMRTFGYFHTESSHHGSEYVHFVHRRLRLTVMWFRLVGRTYLGQVLEPTTRLPSIEAHTENQNANLSPKLKHRSERRAEHYEKRAQGARNYD